MSGVSGNTCPPSTIIVCPVIKPASRLARKTAAYPISSGFPKV